MATQDGSRDTEQVFSTSVATGTLADSIRAPGPSNAAADPPTQQDEFAGAAQPSAEVAEVSAQEPKPEPGPISQRTRRTENQLSRHPWLQETGVHGRQQGVEQCEPDRWLAVLTLTTRIEDELTTRAVITVPSGRHNAKALAGPVLVWSDPVALVQGHPCAAAPQLAPASARNSSNTGPFNVASSARMARAAGPPSITRWSTER